MRGLTLPAASRNKSPLGGFRGSNAGIDDHYGVVKHVMDFAQDLAFQQKITLFTGNRQQK